jgi:putative chitinase
MNTLLKIFSIFVKKNPEVEQILQDAIDETYSDFKYETPIDKKSSEKIIVDVPQNPYTFDFTYEKFSRIVINSESEEWFDALYFILPEYKINTPERVAGFLAQTGHESSDFTDIEENLKYSAQGLRKTFPRRFASVVAAKPFAKNPQLTANKIYGGRMGNGPEEGWKFRGRGPIQITGKSNYIQCSKFLFKDLRLVNDPDLILTSKEICIRSACWFWSFRNINKTCDKNDVVKMTKLINGGTIGLADRKVRFTKALFILKS